MKSPKEKAEELIADFIQMQPKHLDKIDIDMSKQYAFAKAQAEYCGFVAKVSHNKESDDYEYWNDVQKEIRAL